MPPSGLVGSRCCLRRAFSLIGMTTLPLASRLTRKMMRTRERASAGMACIELAPAQNGNGQRRGREQLLSTGEEDSARRADVVVLGDGPAGAVAALTLAESGARVVLLGARRGGARRADRPVPAGAGVDLDACAGAGRRFPSGAASSSCRQPVRLEQRADRVRGSHQRGSWPFLDAGSGRVRRPVAGYGGSARCVPRGGARPDPGRCCAAWLAVRVPERWPAGDRCGFCDRCQWARIGSGAQERCQAPRPRPPRRRGRAV